jgi:hypothetical protein
MQCIVPHSNQGISVSGRWRKGQKKFALDIMRTVLQTAVAARAPLQEYILACCAPRPPKSPPHRGCSRPASGPRRTRDHRSTAETRDRRHPRARPHGSWPPWCHRPGAPAGRPRCWRCRVLGRGPVRELVTNIQPTKQGHFQYIPQRHTRTYSSDRK